MPKFFIAASNIFGGMAYIEGKDAEHLRVLRLKRGEKLIVCDGEGNDYECRLTSSGPEGAEAEIIRVIPSRSEPDVFAQVYAAFPKGDKAETIVQKSVELGASRIVFFRSERCVSRPDAAAIIKKLERWNKISEEAAKQCGRASIPEVGIEQSFETMLEHASQAQLGLFFWEEEHLRSMKKTLEAAGDGITSVSIVTGPEGGFEKHEADTAEKAGLIPVSLGKRILRCETAPLCALAALMYHTNNLE
ncbi:MAG: 16S rRNA (uracil(1498)-N(3))-methyltransferase [Oscillospiraceae bacterium]|nr:16S rRNA (uracil(1498)-N(3))-methyltransferase [Oscillospiraceae bacterium]